MKRKGTILLTIPIFIGAATIIGLNPDYEKVLEYKSHSIKYRQYLREKIFSYTGDYPTNEELVDQAYMRLANRLLDDYLRNKDSQLIDEVVKLSNDHNLRYPMKRYKMKGIDVDSLIRNRDIFLDTTIWVTDIN